MQNYREVGEGLWIRFNASREDLLWYYRALANEFNARGPQRLSGELEIAVQTLEGVVHRPES